MRRIVILQCLLLVLCIGAWAQPKVNILLSDGVTDSCAFNETTKFTFNDGNINVNSASGSKTYTPKDIVKVTFRNIFVPSEIANADFSEGLIGDVNVATYEKDGAVHWMQTVPGWNLGVENGDARAACVVAYGSKTTLGGATYTVPAAGPEGTNGNALAMVAVWTGTVKYVQDVKLAAGKYTMTVPVYNTLGTTPFVKNLIGVTIDGKEIFATAKSYPVGKWTNETITFELEEETVVTFSLGYEGENCGSAASQHLFVDCVKIMTDEEQAIGDVIGSVVSSDGKYLENGKIVIIKNGIKYNAAGMIIR